jgi:hypothetical protein
MPRLPAGEWRWPVRRRLRELRADVSGLLRRYGPVPAVSDPTHDWEVFQWVMAGDERAASRPMYVWGVTYAARLARAIGVGRVSVIELGVAGGTGLLALEAAAVDVESVTGVGIDVYGFDTGTGMPPPRDERDVPYLFTAGAFPMDREALTARLRRGRLVIGDVAETVDEFLRARPAPVGFVALDLDYYSSSLAALGVLAGGTDSVLPRVPVYLDDILGTPYSPHNGELAAVDAFNASCRERGERRSIEPLVGLRWTVPHRERRAPWPDQIMMLHVVDHPRYGQREVQLPTLALDAPVP